MRAWDLKEFGVIDKVIDEPRAAAHRDPQLMAARLRHSSSEPSKTGYLPIEKLVENRYEKFRRMGASWRAELFSGKPASCRCGTKQGSLNKDPITRILLLNVR